MNHFDALCSVKSVQINKICIHLKHWFFARRSSIKFYSTLSFSVIYFQNIIIGKASFWKMQIQNIYVKKLSKKTFNFSFFSILSFENVKKIFWRKNSKKAYSIQICEFITYKNILKKFASKWLEFLKMSCMNSVFDTRPYEWDFAQKSRRKSGSQFARTSHLDFCRDK